MLGATVSFPANHPRDRAFFTAFAATCWAGVLFGFFPSSSARIMGQADYVAPLILHIHAASYVGWLGLLTVQIGLIRTRRTNMHRKFGLIGLLLIPVMAYSGIAAELYSQRFYIGQGDGGLAFFILPLFYTVAFVLFAAAAVSFAHRDPATHKRLILLATTVIVGPAYARWWGEALRSAFGDDYWGMILNSFAGTNLILAAAIAYDIMTRGRPHRAYWIGVPLILLGELGCSWLYNSGWWPPIARQLIEIRLPLT
ncbi:MAG TPA: hypothetical protein PKD99_16110 [Sphingopyxis sp.]|nr:hypothetical protein [Sphingopyxis sp.]